MIKEIRNRARSDQSVYFIKNKYSKSMSISSIIALCMSLLNCIFDLLYKIPFKMCKFCLLAALITWAIRHASFSIFQIARLAYCFSPKLQSRSNKYGYNSWIFYTIYCFWAIIAATVLISATTLPTILFPDTLYDIPNVGCAWKLNKIQKGMFIVVGLGLIVPSDIIYFSLFIGRIYQIKYKQLSLSVPDDEKKRKYLKKMDFLLNKCLSLFIIYQTGFVVMLISICMKQLKHVCYLFADVENVIAVITMYYTIEHNNDEYMKLLKQWRNLKNHLFSCLCSARNEENIQSNMKFDSVGAMTMTTYGVLTDDGNIYECSEDGSRTDVILNSLDNMKNSEESG